MADQDYGNCADCGKPLTEEDAQADFDRRADMISEALEGADWDTCEALLSMFVGLHLSAVDAEDRKKVRRGMIRSIDADTKGWVLTGCDA
jgi:hypothetical protein